MSSVFLQYEIDQYRLHCEDKTESEIPLFRSLENVGRELTKVVDLNSFEKGKHVYFNFGGSTEEMMASKMSLSLLIAYMDVLERHGFETGIYRSTNIRLIKLYEKLGGQLLKETPF